MYHRSKISLVSTCMISAVGLLAASHPAQAQTVVESELITSAPFTSFSQSPQILPVTLGQFDTLGGTRTLTGITFTISPDPGTGNSAAGTLSLHNHSRSSQTAVGNYSETAALKLDTTDLAEGSDSFGFTQTLAANTTAGVPLNPLMISNTGATLLPGSLPAPLTLSDFVGNGNITDPTGALRLVVDDTSALTSHPSIDVSSYSSTTTELVTVTYSYTTTVPEPGAWATLGGMAAFGGLSLMRRLSGRRRS